MASLPLHRSFSFIRSVGEIRTYIRLGVRELLKVRTFFPVYFVATVLASAFIAFVGVELAREGFTRGSSWFFRVGVYVVAVAIDIFTLQYVLGRNRKITVNIRTLTICTLWSTSFFAVDTVLAHFMTPLIKSHVEIANPVVMDCVAYSVVQFVGAALTVWVGFYGLKVFERSPTPLQDNFRLIKTCAAELAIAWFLVSFVWGTIGIVVKYAMEHFYGNPTMVVPVFMSMFLMFFPAVFSPSITAAAYLRVTGEKGFQSPTGADT